jgi:predicted HTH domain antitoxin
VSKPYIPENVKARVRNAAQDKCETDACSSTLTFMDLFLRSSALKLNQPLILSKVFMSMVQIDVPNEVLISLKESPETISQELSILAAVKLFELGKLSSGRSAQLAGMSRVEFLNALGQYHVSPFMLTAEELEHDIENA